MARLTLRIDFDTGPSPRRSPARSLGPGKVRLLELVGETGSISAAGRAMGMSYRRAWLLVDALNGMFDSPAVLARGGGAGGGGASLTPFGLNVVAEYRAMERDAAAALAERVDRLESTLGRAKHPAPTQESDR